MVRINTANKQSLFEKDTDLYVQNSKCMNNIILIKKYSVVKLGVQSEVYYDLEEMKGMQRNETKVQFKAASLTTRVYR